MGGIAQLRRVRKLDRGIPEYRYSLEAEDFSRKTKTMEEVLSLSQETLKKFLLSLSVADQHIMSLEAKITFLKNPKAWEADYLVPDGGQEAQEEEDVNTVINNGAGEQIPQGEEVTQDQDDVRSNHSSPHVSIASSKTIKLKGKSYQAWKKRINDLLNEKILPQITRRT